MAEEKSRDISLKNPFYQRSEAERAMGKVLMDAMGATGGLLKMQAYSKMLTQAIKLKTKMSTYNTMVEQLQELLRVPQSWYKVIKELEWKEMFDPITGKGASGLFTPSKRKISLDPIHGERDIPWHEFTHAEQRYWSPEWGGSLMKRGSKEIVAKRAKHGELERLDKELKDAYFKSQEGHLDKLQSHYYHYYDPAERHAREVAKKALKKTDPKFREKAFDVLYEDALDEAIERAGRDLLRGPVYQ